MFLSFYIHQVSKAAATVSQKQISAINPLIGQLTAEFGDTLLPRLVALLSGISATQQRSLLTARTGYTTLHFRREGGHPMSRSEIQNAIAAMAKGNTVPVAKIEMAGDDALVDIPAGALHIILPGGVERTWHQMKVSQATGIPDSIMNSGSAAVGFGAGYLSDMEMDR